MPNAYDRALDRSVERLDRIGVGASGRERIAAHPFALGGIDSQMREIMIILSS